MCHFDVICPVSDVRAAIFWRHLIFLAQYMEKQNTTEEIVTPGAATPIDRSSLIRIRDSLHSAVSNANTPAWLRTTFVPALEKVRADLANLTQ